MGVNLMTSLMQVLGAAWYLLSVDRYMSCWKSNCKKEKGPIKCLLNYLDCDSVNLDLRKTWVNSTNVFTKCDPKNDFNYGIFGNAVTKHVVSSNFFEKYFYCLWWGLQQLRYDFIISTCSTIYFNFNVHFLHVNIVDCCN